MDISLGKLLHKIEEELAEAKRFHSEVKVRERVYAIKAICELILEESVETTNRVEAKSVTPSIVHATAPTAVQQVEIRSQEKRIKMDDEANGESIFDF